MKQILVILLMVLVLPGYSQTIHFVLFAATNDGDLGTASEATVRYFKYNFVSSLEEIGFTVDARYYDGANFTRSNYTNWLSNLYTSSNDVIIFYFTGHGSNDCTGDWSIPNDYPSLLMGLNNGVDVLKKVKSEMEIFNELKKKPHRLLLTIAEACNKCARERVASKSEVVSYAMEDVDLVKLRSLFAAQGDYIVSSSQKGELSYSSGMGFFTRAFTEVFADETSKISSTTPSWNTFFSKVSTKTTQIAYDYKNSNGDRYIQHPQFTAYGSQTASTEPMLTAAKRVFNKILNNGNYVGNCQNGKGGMKWRNDTQYYFGEFQNGQPNGVGICISYDNVWMGPVKTENSSMTFGSDTYIYDGKGVRKSNGAHSVGYSWNSTLKLIRTKKGNYYFGQVDVNGYYQGYGMFYWQDGRAWVGTFKNGQQEQGGYVN